MWECNILVREQYVPELVSMKGMLLSALWVDILVAYLYSKNCWNRLCNSRKPLAFLVSLLQPCLGMEFPHKHDWPISNVSESLL